MIHYLSNTRKYTVYTHYVNCVKNRVFLKSHLLTMIILINEKGLVGRSTTKRETI